MTKAIESRVTMVVQHQFLGGDESFPLEREMSLIENGICDSMGLVQLATALEGEFPGVTIDDQEITHETMGSVAAIATLLAAKGASG